jgi:hypothetical protein
LAPKRVVIEEAEEMKRKNRCKDNFKKEERRVTLIKYLFPGRPKSSNEEGVDEFRLCYNKESPEDISTVYHRTNTTDICHLYGEFCHSRKLRYSNLVCSAWVHVEDSSADTVVNFNAIF